MNKDYAKMTAEFDKALRIGGSFDLVRRELILSDGKNATMYYIEGLINEIVRDKLLEFFMTKVGDNIERDLPYIVVERSSEIEKLLTAVLSGVTVVIIDGIAEGVIVDTRSYPARSIEEPENDKVMRGSRDGFTETLLTNVALIRRRIRDPLLSFERFTIGQSTRTDVALSYINGRADAVFVDRLKNQLANMKIKALNFNSQSLAEFLIPKGWYNPFPKVRFIERPDAAAAMLLEGSIIIIVDNSPSVIIVPVSIFDFMQESDDYYMTPLTASYQRLLRILVLFVTLFLTPLWYLLVINPAWIPPSLEFIQISAPTELPIIVQLFLVEFAIDGLKLAALNTPTMLKSSFSIVGGLILGDFAVKAGWFAPEVILYMAFVAIAGFTQPSYDLSYALKFMRLIMLTLTAIFGAWGFAVGVVITILAIALNRSIDGGRGYLYPLIPWNSQAIIRLLFRVKLK